MVRRLQQPQCRSLAPTLLILTPVTMQMWKEWRRVRQRRKPYVNRGPMDSRVLCARRWLNTFSWLVCLANRKSNSACKSMRVWLIERGEMWRTTSETIRRNVI